MKIVTSSLRRSIVYVLVFSVFLQACKTSSTETEPTPNPGGNPVGTDIYKADVATQWADLQLTLIRTGKGFTPPVASRALGYTGFTLYESVVGGMAGYQSLVGQVAGLSLLPKPETNKTYIWAVTANAGQASITRNLWANATDAQKKSIDSLETAINQSYKSKAEFAQSAKLGQDIAAAIFEWSKTDGGHEGYTRNQPTNYVPPTGAGFWTQTATGDAGRAVQPTWGNNRPFVPANKAMTMPSLPFVYNMTFGSNYYQQTLEVYTVGKNLTEGQKVVARFWADGGGTITPPGHSYNLATIVLKKENATLSKAAETYAKVGLAVADAFILCWKCKYTYNWQRPITAINAIVDRTWKPLLTTPNFPAFSSGHATQSGASSQILSDLYGYSYTLVDNTHQAKGVGFEPRVFGSFYDAADEAAISRLYGGIHFRLDNELGVSEGRKIGRNVSALKFKK
jgi:hypothetical protein